MEDLPPLPSSRTSSRDPSRQSSSPELTESHLYIRYFVRGTRQRLNFTSAQLLFLDDEQLSELSDGETILVPLSCSALNGLASMTHQLDTITTQLGNIQAVVATLPTFPALETVLAPINASIRDLSQRVSGAPPPPNASPHSASGFPYWCHHTPHSPAGSDQRQIRRPRPKQGLCLGLQPGHIPVGPGHPHILQQPPGIHCQGSRLVGTKRVQSREVPRPHHLHL